jgi:hypothetical protein
MVDREFSWQGDSTTEKFSVDLSELEETVGLRDEWRKEIEPEVLDEEGSVRIRPEADDTRRNSRASGDHNLLHYRPGVVEDAAEEYRFVRQPGQEDEVVVSQGMSFVDALVPEFERPLRSVGGQWSKMVYAPENGGETDEVLLSQNSPNEFEAELRPAGTEEILDAGKISVDYMGDTGSYHENHNEYMTALADQAVGRGVNTSEHIRNGELLISNNLEAGGPIDWDEAQEFVFELVEVDEGDHQVTADWNIDVDYGKETDEAALTYSETSMYAEGFGELESVQKVYDRAGHSHMELYADAVESSARAATQVSLLPLKTGTAAMKAFSARSD